MNTVLKWLACAVTLAGAVCTALRVDPMNIYLLNLGAALYLIWAWRIRELNLIVINAGLLLIYVMGLIYPITLVDPALPGSARADSYYEESSCKN
jgi:hypothetical protein